jgi:hypothetical protein
MSRNVQGEIEVSVETEFANVGDASKIHPTANSELNLEQFGRRAPKYQEKVTINDFIPLRLVLLFISANFFQFNKDRTR